MDKINKVYCEKKDWGDWIDIFLGIFLTNQKRKIVSDLIITEIEDGTYMETPIHLPYESAQMLMDGLWDCGLRPSEGSGSAGALKAIQEHRDNLKEISDRLLKLVENHEKN